MPHFWVEMNFAAASIIREKYGGNKKIINALLAYAHAGEGIAKLDKKEELNELLKEFEAKYPKLEERCKDPDFREEVRNLCELQRKTKKSKGVQGCDETPEATAPSTSMAAAANSSTPKPAAFTPSLSLAPSSASSAPHHVKALIGSVTSVISDAPTNAWLNCTAPLSLEEFRLKVNEIASYAERLFPPGQQGDNWCGDILEKNYEGVATLQARTTNGTLKHLVVENILKRTTLKLRPDLVGEYEWLSEAPYIYDLKETKWMYKKGSQEEGSIRPDIVVHRKGDPNQVVCVIDLKFPCPPGGEPILKERNHPVKKIPILQTALYKEALSPSNGVWLVTPNGIKLTCIPGHAFRRLEPRSLQAPTVLANQIASDSCITLLKKPPFNMRPIASAVSSLAAQFAPKPRFNKLLETENIKKYLDYLEARLSEVGEQGSQAVLGHFGSMSGNSELPHSRPHISSEVRKPVAPSSSQRDTAQLDANRKRNISAAMSSADDAVKPVAQEDSNKVPKTIKASPGATQSSAPRSTSGKPEK